MIKLNGHSPLNEGEVPINLETPTSHIVLNGTDSSSSDAGDTVLTEEGDLIGNEEQELDTGIKYRLLLELGVSLWQKQIGLHSQQDLL